MQPQRALFACVGPCLALLIAGIALTGAGPRVETATPAEDSASYDSAWDSRDCRIVSQSGGGDFTRIQAAIDHPQTVNGTCIVVYPGTYVENINFRGKNILLRSSNPDDPQIVAATIIDGNQANSVVTFGFHETRQATIAGFTIRNGYGYASYSRPTGGGIHCGGDAQPTILNCVVEDNVSYSGGGILFAGYSTYSTYSTFINPLISRCTIRGNMASGDGGGVAMPFVWESQHISAQLDIIDSAITQNSAMQAGGVYAAYSSYGSFRAVNLDHCEVVENQASRGGGGVNAYMAYASYCTFRANTANDYGGGLYASYGYINDSIVIGNTTNSVGGGVALGGGGEVRACLITDNQAATGGGLYSLASGWLYSNTITGNIADNGGGLAGDFDLIIGNAIRDNRASDQGGSIYNCTADIRNNLIELNQAWEGAGFYGCDGDIRDNIIRNNSAGLAGGGLRACDGDIRQNTVVNNWAGFAGGGLAGCWGPINGNIIWGNSALVVGPQIYFSEYPLYCDIQDHDGSGTNNISLDPLLTADQHLTDSSPCINAGDPAFVPRPGETDIDGEPRVLNGRVDIGADESLWRCIPGDFTGDSDVTSDDLPGFITAMLDPLPAQGCLHGDMNGDELINGEDVQPFIEALFNAPQ